MSRDMVNYGPAPESFRPERFLEAKVRDPSLYVFGFGRRYVDDILSYRNEDLELVLFSICPGRYVASNSLFLAISAILQVFTISKAVNEDGSEKMFEPRWEDGLTV